MRSSGLVVLLLASLLASCSSRACTALGGTSGVDASVHALPGPLPADGGPWQVSLCAGELCRQVEAAAGTAPGLTVRDDTLGATPVTARVTVVDAAGATVVDQAVEVLPRRHTPNGPGCGPTVWRGAVALGADGVLRSGDR